MNRGVSPVVVLALLLGCGQREAPRETAEIPAHKIEAPAVAKPEASGWPIPIPEGLEQTKEPRLRQAVEEGVAASRKSPDSAEAIGRLGHVYQAHRWEAEAAQCYRRAVELAPGDYRWHYFLGRSLSEARPEEAARELLHCVEIQPSYEAAHYHAARALRKLGKNGEARASYQRAIDLNPANSLAEQAMGELDLADGQLQAAREHLTRALAIHPDQSEAHGALAKVELALGDRASALKHSAEAQKAGSVQAVRDPLWVEVQNAGATNDWHAVRGAILLEQQQYHLAFVELRQAATDDQDDARFWLNYGACLVNLGRDRDAIGALERALDARPAHKAKQLTGDLRSQVLVNLGIAHAQTNDVKAAFDDLEQARKLDPDSIKAANNLAILHYKQGDIPQATAILDRFLARRPNPRSSQILQLLKQEAAKPAPSGRE